jgi:hypothetical protein
MLTTSAHSVPSGADRSGQPAWRRLVAIVLIALLSPVPALLAFWADASGDWLPEVWVDPASGHVFTLPELDAFSDDIDGDGLSNAQEMWIGSNPFSPDTDGDGISDLLDPLPLSASNLSPANGIIWGAIALDDADGDGTPNFLDDYPYGQYGDQLGSPDMDGDGIPDIIDPAPWDYSNWSSVNGRQWVGDALADADGDGVPNFHDWYPDDSALWDPLQDPDGEGLVKAKDPRPADPYNPSPVNGLNWGPDVYGDADGDGIPNFYDVYPYDSGNGYVPPEPDSDADGIPDSVDPSPWDYDNFSAANGVSWHGDARGDADSDGISNFYDQFPFDYYNGNMPVSDVDGDGIPDAEDPAPTDPTNLSPVNGGLWYTAALADADGDGNPNFTDPWPYDPTNGNLPPEWDSPSVDADADGIPNAQDPALADPLNFSIYNGTSWYADAVGDIDADGIANFRDEHPYDYYNGGYAGLDSDGDGIPDSSDPYPNDPNNGNGDADGDGRPDLQDPYPNDPYDNADSDHDGVPDISDPAQTDPKNLSPLNGLEWYTEVRGDMDSDGVQNFWDLEPFGSPDGDFDGDGLLTFVDPAPVDQSNYSRHNMTSWPSDALGDFDGDGVPNFFDVWPNDSMNGTADADMDGIPDLSDPAPGDPMNYSSYNDRNWYGTEALGDLDNDGRLNFFDRYPEDFYDGNSPVTDPDTDGDGLADSIDPAKDDPYNVSPHNELPWPGGSAVEDYDGDLIINFNDPEHNPKLPEPEPGPSCNCSWPSRPSLLASRFVLLNDNYDELTGPWTPESERDYQTDKLFGKDAEGKPRIVTDGLTPIMMHLPDGYADGQRSIVIRQGGAGEVRVHAVRGPDQDEIVDQGMGFILKQDAGWQYWVEGTRAGEVTLEYEFPEYAEYLDSLRRGGCGSADCLNANYDWSLVEQASNQIKITELTVCSAHLAVDRDRDGVISPTSCQDMTTVGRPFRFWVNDDSDSGEAGDAGIADVPGTASPEGLNNGHIDGSRDLVDFFPVCIDIRGLTQLMPPGGGISYKLRHADGALSFIQTTLSLARSGDYLKDILPAEFGTDFSESASSAVTRRITPEGVELTPRFLFGIQSGGGGVILVEGHSMTDSPLILSVEKEGVVVVELQLHLSLCEVERMYRHVDLTGLAKEYDGGSITPPQPPKPTNMGEPTGLPDSETIDKYFVFVHGFNIDGQEARGWNAEMFKRMYALGSKAKFIGVTWNGTPHTYVPDLISEGYPDYHKAVFHAFLTGDGLAAALSLAAGADVTVAAHSLGNIVVSHAIQSGGFRPSRYYMINAVVPMEALDPSVLVDPDHVPTLSLDLDEQDDRSQMARQMTESDWDGRNPRLFASNWHKLFAGDAGDARRNLKWAGLFKGLFKLTDVYNFYSNGEDVVENPTSRSSLVVADMVKKWDKKRGAWGHQEMLKGGAGLGSALMSRVQGGWSANLAAYSFNHAPSKAQAPDSLLKINPYFNKFQEVALFSPDEHVASAMAAEPKVRYDLLARGIPALSYAAAANRVQIFNELETDRNFNMEADCRLPGTWPTEGHSEEFRAGRWLHSDFKNVALPYAYKMYKTMIDKGRLKDFP